MRGKMTHDENVAGPDRVAVGVVVPTVPGTLMLRFRRQTAIACAAADHVAASVRDHGRT